MLYLNEPPDDMSKKKKNEIWTLLSVRFCCDIFFTIQISTPNGAFKSKGKLEVVTVTFAEWAVSVNNVIN
jgi:hypothetical protein